MLTQNLPASVMAVALRGWFISYDETTRKISQELNLNGSLFVVPRTGDYKKLAKKITERIV